ALPARAWCSWCRWERKPGADRQEATLQIAADSRPWVRHLYRFAYERLYNELACGYDAISWMVSLGQWDRWRRQALRFVYGERILEAGFGTGGLLPLLHV